MDERGLFLQKASKRFEIIDYYFLHFWRILVPLFK
jgi:hypothetical protein